MTTTTERPAVPLAEAYRLAFDLMRRLLPACERIQLAGSVRRNKPEVHDIEMLCVPRLTRYYNLFGEEVGYRNQLDALVLTLLETRVLAHRGDKNGRFAYGERYKRLVYQPSGLALDLFSVLPPSQWGVQLAIRTGPAQWSQRLVTQRRFGGCLPKDWCVKDGALWDSEGELVPTPEERDLFAAIGLAWVEPEGRA